MDLREANAAVSSSTMADGERPVWKKLWSLPIPPKVRVFAWRTAHNGLASQVNKKSRKMSVLNTCALCGGVEDVYHALIQCPHAKNLRYAMRRHWAIPTEEDLNYSGHEWLLRLIDKHDKVVMWKLVLILWRAWFIHNELTHTNRKLCIMGSVNFLMSYWESLCTIRQQPVPDLKGKRPIFPDLTLDGKNQQQKQASWVAPGRETVKINVDGAFSDASQGSYGVVIRDEQGQVLLSAWGIIDNASSAEQVVSVFWTGNLLRGVPEVDECDSPRSATRRKRHATHNLDRFGPRGA
jgi:hypothetical protein